MFSVVHILYTVMPVFYHCEINIALIFICFERKILSTLSSEDSLRAN